MRNKIQKVYQALDEYCKKSNYKGWDPFDGLNSKLFQASPFKYSRFFRLAWIQFFKRSPINFRKLALVPKGYNAKGLALVVASKCNMYKIKPEETLKKEIETLANQLLELENKEYAGACWGYNFDWQARAFFQPKNTPTVVATTFVGFALLDAYDISKNQIYLERAVSSSQFVLNDLNKTYDSDGDFIFSYSPKDSTQVFNAGLLGVRLLSRIYSYTKDAALLDPCKKVVAFCAKHQQQDGSWAYSTLPYHSWIDSFHTGYNLECIMAYQRYCKDTTYQEHINIGFDYYIKNFFEPNGVPKYYNNNTYPIDVHAVAQLVITAITLDQFKDQKERINSVLAWTMDHMKSNKPFFFYQKSKYFTTRIPYMRWTQAWMLYGLSAYLYADFKLNGEKG